MDSGAQDPTETLAILACYSRNQLYGEMFPLCSPPPSSCNPEFNAATSMPFRVVCDHYHHVT